MISVDRLIGEFDRALRAVAGVAHASGLRRRGVSEKEITDEERMHAALMRVNHVGEVCAQALYRARRSPRATVARRALEQAAREEEDHLAWSAERIRELGGRPSLLNPLWYAGAFAIGAVAGALGDRWNLAFLAETERQVEEHLAAISRSCRPRMAAPGRWSKRCRPTRRGIARAPSSSARPSSPSRSSARCALLRVMTTVAYRL